MRGMEGSGRSATERGGLRAPAMRPVAWWREGALPVAGFGRRDAGSGGVGA
jgi:hypothetical protein